MFCPLMVMMPFKVAALLNLFALVPTAAFTLHSTKLLPESKLSSPSLGGPCVRNNRISTVFTRTCSFVERPTLQESEITDDNDKCDNDDDDEQQRTWEELCHRLMSVDENSNTLRLEESLTDTGCRVRGVFANHPVVSGDALLSLPLRTCLRDDDPPEWMKFDEETHDEGDGDMTSRQYNPSDWATRLAAALLDRQLGLNDFEECDRDKSNNVLWFSLLPEPNLLRAALPVHWSDEILQSARCTALEMAVDAAYFTRAQAVDDLLDGLENSRRCCSKVQSFTQQELRRYCEHALDLVQTRSCRVTLPPGEEEHEYENGDNPRPVLRLLVPVFDFINHGTGKMTNARFCLEDDDNGGDTSFVVRAIRDIPAGEEILIDYGDSARPAWKCLASYGFVPPYQTENYQAATDNSSEEHENDEQYYEDPHLAEVYVDGARFEVGPSFIPADMVSHVTAAPLEEHEKERGSVGTVESDEVILTPDIAFRLAKRISEVAYLLLLDPLHPERGAAMKKPETAAIPPKPEEDELSSDSELFETVEEVISAKLAASLRWYQHRILVACSSELKEWAAGPISTPMT